jgi:hypothetical protein
VADLAADGILLAGQETILRTGDMATIVAGVEPFLRPDAAILGMQVMRQGRCDLAIAAFDIDAMILAVSLVFTSARRGWLAHQSMALAELAARAVRTHSGGIGLEKLKDRKDRACRYSVARQ